MYFNRDTYLYYKNEKSLLFFIIYIMYFNRDRINKNI